MKVMKKAGELFKEMISGNPPEWHSERIPNLSGESRDSDVIAREFSGNNTASKEQVFPVSRNYEYPMNHLERGCFLIFNQTEFDHLPERKFAKDAYLKMKKVAERLGFEHIRIFHEKTKKEILQVLRAYSESSHDDYDCFAVAFFSHGSKTDTKNEPVERFYAKDKCVYLDDLTDWFTPKNCPSLAFKPKLFFIQACRGEKDDMGSKIIRDISQPSTVESDALCSMDDEASQGMIIIPNQADFFVAFSSSANHRSWNNRETGSWFVNAIYECIKEYGVNEDIELLQFMTRVINKVCTYVTKDGQKMQVPSLMSQLCSTLYFRTKSKPIGVQSSVTPSGSEPNLNLSHPVAIDDEEEEEC